MRDRVARDKNSCNGWGGCVGVYDSVLTLVWLDWDAELLAPPGDDPAPSVPSGVLAEAASFRGGMRSLGKSRP